MLSFTAPFVVNSPKRPLWEQRQGERSYREIADQYAGQDCTLVVDGKSYPAKIAGRLNTFATIAPLDCLVSVEGFSWQAVERIMESDKIFRV